MAEQETFSFTLGGDHLQTFRRAINELREITRKVHPELKDAPDSFFTNMLVMASVRDICKTMDGPPLPREKPRGQN